MAYQYPPKFETGIKLKQRIEMEPDGWDPVRHENTGVNEEEALYESYLLPVEEAVGKLGGKGVSADVVRKGWGYISQRKQMEESEN